MAAKKVTKKQADEREYVINLRRAILQVPRHKRTPKAIKALKQFVAKHMRVPDRDLRKIKIDKWLNQELWFRGIKNPVTKVKVKVKRDGENILVSLVELAEKPKFAKAREDKKKAVVEKTKKEKAAEEKAKAEAEKKAKEESKQTDEEKKEEKEKEKSAAEVGQKAAGAQAKQQKHLASPKSQKVRPQRKALQK